MNRSLISTLHLRRAAALALAAALVVALAAAPLGAQRNARVLHRNLDELVSDASIILSGKVAGVRQERHPQYNNFQTVLVTFQVDEVLKGQVGPQYTVRLYVDDAMDIKTSLGYKLGEEYFLLLTRPSEAGFSSPAGLEQGRFRVRVDAQGNRFLVNGYNNMGLFGRLDTTSPASKLASRLNPAQQRMIAEHRAGPLPSDDLKNVIRAVIAAQAQ